MFKSAEQYYIDLVENIVPTDLNEWEDAIRRAEQRRKEDITVMDIIGTILPSSEVEAESANDHRDTDVTNKWMRLGIIIEELQYVPSSSFRTMFTTIIIESILPKRFGGWSTTHTRMTDGRLNVSDRPCCLNSMRGMH
jgi:hypothetical protein